jgi:phosphoribosyl 1,2-cyclic phosphodiesterase
VKVYICGARGSTPAPGPEYVRYGGHTSCVAVAHGDELPSLVLDAGTGLQRLNRVFDGRAFAGSILLGHLHWDHTHGLPFFPAGDRPEARVHLFVPAQEGGAKVLEQLMAPPHFPITPDELRGDWVIDVLEAGEHTLEGFDVLCLDIPHKGGRTFGFRVADASGSLAYLSDHSPVNLGPGAHGDGEVHEAALALAQGVDVLIHDAQYTAAEFDGPRKHFGHSTVDYALRLAEHAGAARLVLFHHDSARTDDSLDALVASLAGAPVPVVAATEGAVLEIPAGAHP